MRRTALSAATALTALTCALLPSGALAHGHHHHARGARSRHHHHHRGLHAGFLGTTGSSGSSHIQNVGPGPGTPQGNAGKILSFTEGVLTIQLGEGENATTISGKVTNETEIHCIPAPMTASMTPSPGTTSSSHDDGWKGGEPGQQGEQGWSGHGDDRGSGDDRNGGDRDLEGGEHCQCSTTNLTPGTVVHRAELLLTESGAVFREIELVH